MQDSMCGSLSLPLEKKLEADGGAQVQVHLEGEESMDSPETSSLCWIDSMIEFEQIMEEDTPLASTSSPHMEVQQPLYAPTAYAPTTFKAVQPVPPVSGPHRIPSPALPVMHPSHTFADVPGFGIPRSSSPSLPNISYTAFVDSSSSSHRQHAQVAHGHVHGHGQQQPMAHYSQGQPGQGQVALRQQQQQQQQQQQLQLQHQAHFTRGMSISRSHSPAPATSLTSVSHAAPNTYHSTSSGSSNSATVYRGLPKVLSAPQLEQLGLEQPRSASPQGFLHQAGSIASPAASTSSTITPPRRVSVSRSHSHNQGHGLSGPDYAMDQYGQQQQQQQLGGHGSPRASHQGSPHGPVGAGGMIAIAGRAAHGGHHGHAHSRKNSLSGQLSHSFSFSNSPPSQQSQHFAAATPSYAQLAIAPPLPSTNSSAAISMDMPRSSAHTQGSQSQEVEQQDSGLQLVHLLLACADAVAQEDFIVAKGMLLQLQQMVSPLGDSMHRVAAYFTDALHSRLMGKGSRSYMALRAYDPVSSEGVLDAYQILYQACPYIKFAHFTSNQAIFEAFDGEERVHIIDLDIIQGYQWPTLMQALAARHGGAPQLRITGVGMPMDAVQETGKRLAELAEFLHIPFEFHAVGERMENLQSYMLQRRVGEALAVNSVNRLHRLLSMSNDPMTPLVGILHMIREQAPKIVTLVEQEASHNDQFFLPRFLEALHYYSAIFDSLDATLPQASPERAKVEQVVFAQEITNIVACEGTERVERHEKLERWRKIMDSIGFQSVALSQNAYQQSHLLLGLYPCEGYTLVEDRGCLLLGWQDRPIIAASAWRC